MRTYGAFSLFRHMLAGSFQHVGMLSLIIMHRLSLHKSVKLTLLMMAGHYDPRQLHSLGAGCEPRGTGAERGWLSSGCSHGSFWVTCCNLVCWRLLSLSH